MSDVPVGRFVWCELMTSDPEAAESFYSQVTGWSAVPWEDIETPYTMWMAGELPVGGLMKLPPEAGDAPPHWIAYLSTPNAADTIRKAEGLGGSVVWGPMDVPTVGTLAALMDPQGAYFAILQPATEAPGHDEPAGVGEFSWFELATTDWEAAWDFYSSLFDWRKSSAMDMGEMGIYQVFNRGAHDVGGIFNRPAEAPVSHWLPYVRVSDVSGTLGTLKLLGGQVLNGPMEVPGGDTIAQCLDPQGAAFAMHAKAPAI